MNNNLNIFYVYLFWRKDKNEVFHIGKGKENRMYDLVQNRNDYFKRICAKTEVYSTIYKSGLSEDEAFELEKKLIAEYRQKGLAYTNFHEGGKGGNVYKYDGDKRKEEMKRKCSESLSGENNPMFGKNWKDYSDEETIKQHSKNMSIAIKKRYECDEYRKNTANQSKLMWSKDGHKEKYRENNSKKVHMYDKEMNYLRTFLGIHEALEFLDLKSHTTLLKSIRLNKIYKGYYWKREELKGVTTIENPSKQMESVE